MAMRAAMCIRVNERTAARHGWPGLFAFLGVVALVMAGGCAAGDRAELQGTVTVAGTAVEKGGIMLEPIAGTKGPTAGGAVTAGRYRLTGRESMRPGEFLVRLSAVRKTGRMVESAALPGAKTEEFVDIIPPEYGCQSTLKVDIKPGVNTLDITSRSRGRAHGAPGENPAMAGHGDAY